MDSKKQQTDSRNKGMPPSAKAKQPPASKPTSCSSEENLSRSKKKSESKKHVNEQCDSCNDWCLNDKCEDCCRERHMYRRMNGHQDIVRPLWPGREPGVPPRSQLYHMGLFLGDLPTVGPANHVQHDDMENYFNANAGILHDSADEEDAADAEKENRMIMPEDYNVYEDWIINEHKSQMPADEGVEMVVTEDSNADEHGVAKSNDASGIYLCLDHLMAVSSSGCCDSTDSLYNHCEDELYQCNIGNSIEDLGDFIETDIPRNSFGSGSSDSNSSHSDDESSSAVIQVTGAGDIQGALSLDWTMQLNIEHAQRPPTLSVSARQSNLSSDSSSNKPRTGSDTDYGFFTPTSCASGSSLRTQSVQSPVLSETSVTCGMASSESSTFTSPDTDQQKPAPSLRAQKPQIPNSAVSNREVQYWKPLKDSEQTRQRPHSDGHMYAKHFLTELDMDNLDTVLTKPPKDKHIDVKLSNETEPNHLSQSLSARHLKKHKECATMSSHYDHIHSSLPQLAAKSANGIDSLCCCFEYNNLNPTKRCSLKERASDSLQQFNVSRQTSTSDFDQDENSFQEFVNLPPMDTEASGTDTSHNIASTLCPDGHGQENEENRLQPLAPECHCADHQRSSQQVGMTSFHEHLEDSVEDHVGGDILIDLLQKIQVVDIQDKDKLAADSNADDIPLPPQTPILNRQWLKRAAKLLGQVTNGQSDSDSDETAPDLAKSEHLSSREKMYSAMLKDALLKHLQETSDHYQTPESDSSEGDVKKVMLWTEYQAYVLQVSQIGTSACGATAVINVLKCFDLYVEREKVCSAIRTNLRAETAPVGEYLLSRSVAGTTAEDLISGIKLLTDGAIVGRFFAMYPERDISILKWLGEWIEKGSVPVVTLNRQRAVPEGWVIPDAWHHQMVYGVGPKGVYLTNPLEIIPEYVIQKQLCSESVLLIKRNDVLSRWKKDTNLGVLLQQDDVRWQEMNVLGQVVNILREDRAPPYGTKCPQLTSHISIPAWYKSGITLFVQRNSEACSQLMAMPAELPLRQKGGKPEPSADLR